MTSECIFFCPTSLNWVQVSWGDVSKTPFSSNQLLCLCIWSIEYWNKWAIESFLSSCTANSWVKKKLTFFHHDWSANTANKDWVSKNLSIDALLLLQTVMFSSKWWVNFSTKLLYQLTCTSTLANFWVQFKKRRI